MKRYPTLAAACLIVAGWSAGCAAPGPPAPVYDLTLQNAADQPVTGATVRFGEYDLADVVGDSLRPGERATHFDLNDPVPAQAQVLWTDADGRPHEQTIDLSGRLPPGFGFDGARDYKDRVDYQLEFKIRAGNEMELTVLPGREK